MTDESAEVIQDENAIRMLQDWISFRQAGKMEIPDKGYRWLTLLLGFSEVRKKPYLLIDKVAGFEKFFSRSIHLEVILEFRESDGVSCWFRTRVIECQPKQLVAEVPKTIYRLQKRRFFRVKARSGTVILFSKDRTMGEEASVIDYSLAGLAFWANRSLPLQIGDQLTQMELRVPEKDQWIRFQIPLAVVRRLERHSPGRDLCAVEFLEMAELTKEALSKYLFQEQRIVLRRTRRN